MGINIATITDLCHVLSYPKSISCGVVSPEFLLGRFGICLRGWKMLGGVWLPESLNVPLNMVIKDQLHGVLHPEFITLICIESG